jgi:nucleoside-diphosphate-sugar epimerase
MFVDFAIIHIAVWIAYAVSVFYQSLIGDLPASGQMINSFRGYYFSSFLLLSPLFPIVFFANGLYTYVRPYETRAKLRRFAVIVCLSLAVFISANFLMLEARNPVGRSIAVAFAAIALVGLVGIRVVKEWLVGSNELEANAKTSKAEASRVLVIGGAGYIGCWLVKRLLDEGALVRVLDNAVYGLEPIQDLLNHPNLDYVNGDSRNIQDVVKAMRGVNSVVHLAAIVGDPACEIDHKTTIEINYAATRMLVEIAKGYGVERFLFASSCSVYGATDELMDENSTVTPVSLYGETKAASEQALLESATPTFHPVIMRFATVFGLSNRPRFDLVVNLLSARARQEGLITIFNGCQWRPFVHVKDLAEAILLLLKAPCSVVSGEVFNIGDRRLNHTLGELGEIIRGVFPGTRVEETLSEDRRNYRVNFNKIEKLIGFHSRFTLEDGVLEIKAAFDTGRITNYKDIRFSNLVFLRESGTPENKTKLDREVMAAFGGEHIRRIVAETMVPEYHVKAKAAGAR